MKKDQLLEILKANSSENNGDFEVAHSIADEALIAYIADHEIEKAYGEVGKWYA